MGSGRAVWFAIVLAGLLGRGACSKADGGGGEDGGPGAQEDGGAADAAGESAGDAGADGAASCDPAKQNCPKTTDDCSLVCFEGGFRCYPGSGSTPHAHGDACTGDCGRGLICIG